MRRNHRVAVSTSKPRRHRSYTRTRAALAKRAYVSLAAAQQHNAANAAQNAANASGTEPTI
jgi:hypothetical protein